MLFSILQESSKTRSWNRGGLSFNDNKKHTRRIESWMYEVCKYQSKMINIWPYLSLLSSGSRTRGISTKSESLLRTASHWIVFVMVGRLWKWSIPGRPFPAGSSVTVNFRSYKHIVKVICGHGNVRVSPVPLWMFYMCCQGVETY